MAASTDTSARDVQIGITKSAVFYILATKTVSLTAGHVAGVAAVNLLNTTDMPGLPVDSDGQVYLFLSDANDTLQIKSLTTVTAAKEIDINAIGADF